MCQLLAMSCKQPANIGFSFTGFRARGGRTDEHRDGWGIAFYREQRAQIFLDESPAAYSHLAEAIQLSPWKSKTIIAHIRKATVGDVKLSNCHPFHRQLWGKDWVFCHNGNLDGFLPNLDPDFQPEGETDSERAFCLLLQQLKQESPQGSDNLRSLFSWLNEFCEMIAGFGSFNIILSNGDWLYTYCATNLAYVARKYPFNKVRLVDVEASIDLSAHNHQSDQMILVATKPLTTNEHWNVFQPGEARLFVDGELLLENVRQPSDTAASINSPGQELLPAL